MPLDFFLVRGIAKPHTHLNGFLENNFRFIRFSGIDVQGATAGGCRRVLSPT
jgi:hypothetical protein